MTRKRQRKVLVLESMEKRVVLSHVAALPATEHSETAAPMEATTASLSVAPRGKANLNGSFQGTWTEDRSGLPVDDGIKTMLNGTGKLGASTSTTVKGQLNGIGYAFRARVTGTLTLTNAQGSVTIQLTGPWQRAGRPLPSQYSFTIQSGTGIYANAQVRGIAKLTFLNGLASPVGGGSFALSLKATPVRT